MPAPLRHIYHLHVQLQGASPNPWRRLQVANTTTLAQLHRIVQAAFGWHQARTYRFCVASQCYGLPQPDVADDTTMDARRYTLGQLMQHSPVPLHYTCEQGQQWGLRIKVESIQLPAPDAPAFLAECSGGKHAVPSGNANADATEFDLAATQQRVRAVQRPSHTPAAIASAAAATSAASALQPQ